MLEADFQRAVIDLAHACGWLVHHARPARRADGQWRTPIAGDAGFPDLVLVHGKRGLIFAELKTQRGRTTTEQDRWLNTLEEAINEATFWLEDRPDAEIGAVVWRPADWPEIEQTLTGKTRRR